MASINQMVKDATRSLDIRRGREEKINAELEAASAAFGRVQARLAAAEAAKEKNDADIAVYQNIVTALGAVEDKESHDTDESPAEDESTEAPADSEPATNVELVTESAEETTVPKRARRGSRV
jgi:hypothetical protein